MKELVLKGGTVVKVSDEDFEIFRWLPWKATDAALAYNKKATEIRGDIAYLNDVKSTPNEGVI